MDLFEAISKRRSVRKFNPAKPVDDTVVRKILEAAIAAPSAGNGQSWRFFVIRDKEIKKRLAYEAGHQLFIDQAPVAIVVCSDLNMAEERYGERGRKTYSLQETAAAIENILLSVTSLGLGSCWVGAFNEDIASQILGLPDHIRPLAILPIGEPLEVSTRVPPRKALEEVTTFK